MTLAETSIGRIMTRRRVKTDGNEIKKLPIQAPENRYEFRKWMDGNWQAAKSEFLDGRTIEEMTDNLGPLSKSDRQRVVKSYSRRMKTMEMREFADELDGGQNAWSKLYKKEREAGTSRMKAVRKVDRQRALSIPEIILMVQDGRYNNFDSAEEAFVKDSLDRKKVQALSQETKMAQKTPDRQRNLQDEVKYRNFDWPVELRLQNKWLNDELETLERKTNPFFPYTATNVEEPRSKRMSLQMRWNKLSYKEKAGSIVLAALCLAIITCSKYLPTVVEYIDKARMAE